MGYRVEFLRHAGAVAGHVEATLHAIDREIPDGDVRVLVAGVGNGGTVEVWRALGADVLGIDRDARCAGLGLPVVVCDVTVEGDVRGALQGRMFDVIVDSTRQGSPWLWPYLKAGGRIIFEDAPDVTGLLVAVAEDRETWLPVEEIMRVTAYPRVTVVEKRNPRVVPYLDLVAGNFADVTPEGELIARGARWVVN